MATPFWRRGSHEARDPSISFLKSFFLSFRRLEITTETTTSISAMTNILRAPVRYMCRGLNDSSRSEYKFNNGNKFSFSYNMNKCNRNQSVNNKVMATCSKEQSVIRHSSSQSTDKISHLFDNHVQRECGVTSQILSHHIYLLYNYPMNISVPILSRCPSPFHCFRTLV